MNELSQIPQNYKNSVNWIIGAYEGAGVSFPNGFQKDAIQNAVGARKTKKWKNWKCDISVVKNEKGVYVIVEDFGTQGLTGKNMSTDDINKYMEKDISLGSNERLARFTSMFNSGGNTTGGGLFGAGKSVYSVASNDYTYYFDSLREDGIYIANHNKAGQVHKKAFENEEAKRFIKSELGLENKTTVGTRVIIVNPKKELMDSINSGEIIKYIQESWWLIIERLPQDSCISVNGVPVGLPDNYKNGNKVFELESPEKYSDTSYRVKHFGLYVFEDGKNIWQGISYYRKGMKIGEIDLKDIPSKINKKFWGYIEVDESWEEELAEIEDTVHFGVNKYKKTRRQFQNLRNYTNKKFKDLLIGWGYIKDRESEDRKLKQELQEIAEDIQGLFDSLGFEDLGKGPQKSNFDVRLKNISYPQAGTEKVTSNDMISFCIRISNSYLTKKKFDISINIIDAKTHESISNIYNNEISINPSNIHDEVIRHKVTSINSRQYSENRIVIKVKVIGSNKEKNKELPFFYDVDKPDNSREIVKMTVHSCEFPNEQSRRVNYGESLKNITYRLENKRNQPLSYKLSIRVHNATDPMNQMIEHVASFEGLMMPFEEVITEPIKEIKFSKEVYEKYIQKGVLELRATLIANDDDDMYEKGDKITFYYLKFYLNSDEKNGKNDAFDIKSQDLPDNPKRSWCEAGDNRVIILNVGHIAYTRLSDYPELQHEYLREQMLKQYVLLYLDEGKFDMFDVDNKKFTDMDPQDAANNIINKIEDIYYKSIS
ncbi:MULTISPECIES: hypothetical protein [Coprobacillaceae]|uniref:hypothetical protein n=1 Tax=Coprobacillaceae TaxID=2810280 RepID=UPI000E468063|nr:MULTISPECIES: hypothetical protein [Coprobacillaceae]RHM63162.1 hypothetical protein DWZ53_01610 [Coprobacillus sp. AF33-1AC]RHS93191.1 hypothetical protein DW911_06970 [Erysipelatoclostridium sp. AM42-17]